MRVSFIISTHNRREVLLRTLSRLRALQLAECEIHVVDNASRDGTAAALAAIPQIKLHAQRRNRGPCAKNLALPHARGEFLVFLDDDSYPLPGSIERMIQHFHQNPRLGAASFTITLPDGSRECSAYPNIFIGCGVGLRRSAIEQIGGLPEDFFMQAEEYDLSLRLLDAGWEVRTFDDLHVEHLKTPVARASNRTMRLDVRNNLILVACYFPRRWAVPFAVDWLRRYGLLASARKQRRAFVLGLLQGLIGAIRTRRRCISDDAFERFARIEQIHAQLCEARDRHPARRVLFVDLGKNMLAYRRAARECGLKIVAIADDRLAGRRYRGIPIVTDQQATLLDFDLAIIANTSPVHAQRRLGEMTALLSRPVVDLLASDELRDSATSLRNAA
jgi:GT2 family glycosyltransferase